MQGTNKGQDNGEAMTLVGVRLTAQLGADFFARLCVARDYGTSQSLSGRASWRALLYAMSSVRHVAAL